MWFVRLQKGGVGLPLKVVDHFGDSCEAVYAAQFAIHMFVPEPFAYGGTRFDGVKLDALGGEFVSHAGERVRTLHIHTRCGGQNGGDLYVFD